MEAHFYNLALRMLTQDGLESEFILSYTVKFHLQREREKFKVEYVGGWGKNV